MGWQRLEFCFAMPLKTPPSASAAEGEKTKVVLCAQRCRDDLTYSLTRIGVPISMLQADQELLPYAAEIVDAFVGRLHRYRHVLRLLLSLVSACRTEAPPVLGQLVAERMTVDGLPLVRQEKVLGVLRQMNYQEDFRGLPQLRERADALSLAVTYLHQLCDCCLQQLDAYENRHG